MPVVELPSGLTGELRRLKVKDENLLTNRRAAKDGTMISKLLNSCWVQTVDAGPYKFGDKGFDAELLLQGDKFEALRQLRIISYPGDEHYDFAVTCPRCQATFEWSIDLRDLDVKKLPEEVKQKLSNNEPLEMVLPECGKRVLYRLITGKDELRFARALKNRQENLSTVQLATQIVEIEGEQNKTLFIEDMSSYDAMHFRQESEKNDCGVKTDIAIECQDCFNVFDFDVPFGLNFILPKQRKNGT